MRTKKKTRPDTRLIPVADVWVGGGGGEGWWTRDHTDRRTDGRRTALIELRVCNKEVETYWIKFMYKVDGRERKLNI